MLSIDRKTRTVRFFLAKYGTETVRSAIEMAARLERRDCLPGLAQCAPVPVDVEAIASIKGIEIRGMAAPPSPPGDNLLPTSGASSLEAAGGRPEMRRRFSIAHEIGHSLFLEGQTHRVGVLSEAEIAAEERLCDRFAGALLMPSDYVKHALRDMPDDKPWPAFRTLEQQALRLQVSLPALIVRLSEVQAGAPFPLVVLLLRWLGHSQTKELPCLRVETCASLGGLRNARTWHNKSALHLGLSSALLLFEMWRSAASVGTRNMAGRYTAVSDTLKRLPSDGFGWREECPLLDVKRAGRWHKETLRMKSANVLYAAEGWDHRQAYIITLLKASGASDPVPLGSCSPR